MSLFVSRTDAHTKASAAMLTYNKFREGLAVELDPLKNELGQTAAILGEIIEEDDQVFKQALSEMSNLNQLSLTSTEDDLLSLFGDEEAAPEPVDSLDDTGEPRKSNLALLEETISRICGIFDLSKPSLTGEDVPRDHRVLADLIQAFGNSELDPLRIWGDSMQVDGESIVEDRPPLKEATNDERSFRALFTRLVNTVVTRTQYAKVANAANVLTGLLADDYEVLSEAAATEYKMLLRLRVVRQYSMFLGSLDGRMPEPPSSMFKL
ncbi:hypothetical protein BH10CYA1_BH10CYA1_53630 [soil metagenome]